MQSPEFVDILLYLNSRKLAGEQDIENHTIPVLEVLEVEGRPDLCVVVTPLMRCCDDPWFENMGEAVDFLGQVLEVGHFLYTLIIPRLTSFLGLGTEIHARTRNRAQEPPAQRGFNNVRPDPLLPTGLPPHRHQDEPKFHERGLQLLQDGETCNLLLRRSTDGQTLPHWTHPPHYSPSIRAQTEAGVSAGCAGLPLAMEE